MNEAETRAEHIDPALKAAGWGVVEGSRVMREYRITEGRLQGAGQRSKAESVSRTIRDAIEMEKIKIADSEQSSLRYRSYIPIWA